MSLSVAVQHTPGCGREPRVAAIVEELAVFDPVVVTDPEPLQHRSPWRTYRACLERHGAVTHHLVVQDDMILMPGLADVLPSIVAGCTERLLALCVCYEPAESARHLIASEGHGCAWAEMDMSRWMPALANIWPVWMIAPALAWVDEQGWPDSFNADDEIIGRILRGNGWLASATVPSLAHHDDMVESVAGQKAAYGANLNRVTAVWRPEVDIRRIKW